MDLPRQKLCELLMQDFYLPVAIVSNNRLRWFGHVEQKDDNDWVKRCITWEVEGIRQRGRLKRHGGIVLRMTWKV